MSEYQPVNDQSTCSASIRKNSSGLSKFGWLILILFIIVAGFAAITLWNHPSLQKRIPRKDPYSLISLDQKREDLYAGINTRNPDSNLLSELAESAFLQGEIHEAEYYLSRMNKFDLTYKSIKTKIDKFKFLRGKLEESLYNERRFYNEPFLYTEEYEYINKILELSDAGYINVRHRFLKGYLLLREGRRTEARRIFDDLRKNGGVLADTSLYLYAKSFILDVEITDGILAFEEYVTGNSESRLAPLACYYLSTFYLQQNRIDDALKIVQSAIDTTSESEYLPELYQAKESALRISNPDKAEKALINLLVTFPSSQIAFNRALEVYDEWDQELINTDKSDLLLEVCNVLVDNGRFDQSKKLLDVMIPNLKEKKTAYALYILGKRYRGVGEYDTCLKQCKKAIESSTDPKLKCHIYTLMGEVYGLKKDVPNTEKYYSLAGKEKSDISDYALREIARIAYQNGWRKKAETYYSEILTSYSESEYLSEALNYLVVLTFYKNDKEKCEKYARMLKLKGTAHEDRLKGDYFLYRLGKGNKTYSARYPLSYYSFIVEKKDVSLYLDSSKAYPDVNAYKNNLAWEYFLSGCFDLAEKECLFVQKNNNPYQKLMLCYLGFMHKAQNDGIKLTRDFTAGNYQASIEKGYALWFYDIAFPMKYYEDIEKQAQSRNFATHFVLGIIHQESFFNPKARSYAGALGLMQIMPSTGKWVSRQFGESRQYKNSKLFDPATNLKYGLWYLDHLREQLGNESGMILAGHNGGPGNVSRWKEMFPIWNKDPFLFYELIPSMQTRNFVRYVSANQRVYEQLVKQEKEKVHF